MCARRHLFIRVLDSNRVRVSNLETLALQSSIYSTDLKQPRTKNTMRLSFLFLTIAAVALLSNDIVSAVEDAEDSVISTMASPDQVHSIDAGDDKKRFLRVHKTSKLGEDGNEERGFNSAKFNRLMNDAGYRSTRFANWVRKGYIYTKVYELLQAGSYPMYKRIFRNYQDHLKNFAPKLISK